MHYGAVEGQPRQLDSVGSASQTRRIIMTVLGVTAACCLFALISENRTVDLVEEADGLELSAYLSAPQIALFKNLRNEQESLDAEIDGLEKRERTMQPEDTKVFYIFLLQSAALFQLHESVSPRDLLTPLPLISISYRFPDGIDQDRIYPLKHPLHSFG
jgi:hypothetical protein